MKFPARWIVATFLFFAVALQCVACREPGGLHRTSPWTFEGVPRIIAVGDTHGGFAQVQEILLGLDLVDRGLHWTGGNTHLVFVGDLTDRGPGDRPILDLVMRLQGEAEKVGGRVHVLLGNHEVMNMMQDLRYVSPEGYEAFRVEEDPEVRREAFSRFDHQIRGEKLSQEEVRRRFEESYPPGYFGRRDAFGPDGSYSRWLLEQQVIIRLNGIVFVHGGLTEEVAGLGYEGINRAVMTGIRNYWELREVLIDSGKVTASDDFRKTMGIAAEFRSEMAAKVEKSPAVTRSGPLWYRGTSLENEDLERERLAACLEMLGGRSVVLGHSITEGGRITSRFGGRVFRADVGMAYPDGGDPQALVIENGEVRVFNARTGVMGIAVVELPEGESALSRVE